MLYGDYQRDMFASVQRRGADTLAKIHANHGELHEMRQQRQMALQREAQLQDARTSETAVLLSTAYQKQRERLKAARAKRVSFKST